jgi:ketosteroid isomerase-like protein
MAAQPEEAVERVNGFLDGIERGDVEAAVGAAEPLVHPEMQFTSMIGSEVEGRTFIGLDGLREWFGDYTETFEVLYEDRRITVLGNRAVLGLYTCRMKGRGSELEVSRPIGTVWELEDGLIIRAVTYPDQDDAVKAAEALGA